MNIKPKWDISFRQLITTFLSPEILQALINFNLVIFLDYDILILKM